MKVFAASGPSIIHSNPGIIMATDFLTFRPEAPPVSRPDPAGEAISPQVTLRGVRVDFASDHTIHGVIEEQVGRTPDATALIAGCRQLTYRELDERANRLANVLQDLGVG